MKQLMVDADRAESSPELYEAFVHRYFKTVHAIDSGVRTVNHCGNLALMTADQIDRVYGPSIKILIWRDPRAAYVSAKSGLIRRGQSPTEADLRSFCREYRTGYKNYLRSPNISLRFEELVGDPATSMRSLAESLEIAFRPSLLNPTVFGKPREANTSFERAFGVVDANAAGDWESRIDARDRAVIEYELGDVLFDRGLFKSAR